jgi:hypothetical protein
MIRSGRAFLFVMAAACALGGVAVVFLVLRFWLALAFLGVAWVVLVAGAVFLIGRADPDELKRRSARAERNAQQIGRALGHASGGWDTRPPRPTRRQDKRG